MIFYAKTHKGLVRKKNEDSCYAPEHNHGFVAIVADGMGGHSAGEVASQIVIETLRESLEGKATESITEKDVSQALILANKKVWEQAELEKTQKGMGSTATLAVFSGDKTIIGHVGDSRAYLFRNGRLEQLTKDHSYVQILIESGYITKEEALNHPHRNIITRAIGTENEVEADVFSISLKKGDMLLLCSDGLNITVSDKEIKEILNSGAALAADKLVEAALSAGGMDNISVVIAEMDGGTT